jgi:hypothetical protein
MHFFFSESLPDRVNLIDQMSFVSYGQHALVGKDIFTIIQGDGSVFDRLPYPREAPGPESVVLDKIWQTGWISNEVPFMVLVPVYRPFYGPLFHRLRYDHRSFPIERHPAGGWSLNMAVMEGWVALERNMRALAYAMLECGSIALPRYFRFWSPPERYGYRLRYPNRRIALDIAARSRDAFIPLMAALSFALMIMNWLSEQVDGFDWREKVLKKTAIHPQWLADLEMSAVGDKDDPKVGGIIDMSKCEFVWILRLLEQFKLPLYLYWGDTVDHPLGLPEYFTTSGIVPGRAEIDHLLSRANSKRLPSQPPATAPAAVSLPRPADIVTPATGNPDSAPAPRQMFPPVERYSGQRPGEDWQSFFARRAKSNDTQAERETPQQREKRRQREAHAAKDGVPGKKGARVYVWEDVDGFLIRRAAGRGHYQTYWEEFGRKQRRYDSFRDEWDLCEQFDPTDRLDTDDDDEYDNNAPTELPLLPEDGPSHLPNHNEGTYSSSADLQRIHDMQDSDDRVMELNNAPDDLVYYRFGFVNPIGTVEEPPVKQEWKTVQKWLGMGWQLAPSKQESICIFFSYLARAKSLSDIPKELYDLRQDDADVHCQWKIHVRCEILDNQRHYIITPRSTEKARMELVLTSAASVVEIVRQQWGLDPMQIVHELLHRGIAFNTCIRGCANMPLIPRLVYRYGGLGYRPQGYKPDHIDYAVYESLRHRFLCSQRGRAAMLAGGIVARLAREDVRYEDVCNGPSDSVFEDGICLWDGEESSLAYWDDKLSEDEVDLICGVYRVDTGMQTTNQFVFVITLLRCRSTRCAPGPSNHRRLLVAQAFSLETFGSQHRLLVKRLRVMVSKTTRRYQVRKCRSKGPS